MSDNKLTPEMLDKLNANSKLMQEQGYSREEIKSMAKQFFNQFAVDELGKTGAVVEGDATTSADMELASENGLSELKEPKSKTYLPEIDAFEDYDVDALQMIQPVFTSESTQPLGVLSDEQAMGEIKYQEEVSDAADKIMSGIQDMDVNSLEQDNIKNKEAIDYYNYLKSGAAASVSEKKTASQASKKAKKETLKNNILIANKLIEDGDAESALLNFESITDDFSALTGRERDTYKSVYYNVENALIKKVDEDISKRNLKEITEIDANGIQRADIEKINEAAKDIAKQFMPGGIDVEKSNAYRTIYEKLKSKVEEFRYIEPTKKAAKEDPRYEPLIEKIGESKWDNFVETSSEAKVLIEQKDSIFNNVQSELNEKLDSYYKNNVVLSIKNYEDKLKQDIYNRVISVEEANEKLNSYQTQQINKYNLVEENYNKKANGLFQEKAALVNKDIDVLYNSFQEEYSIPYQDLDKLNKIYSDAYKKTIEDEGDRLKLQEDLAAAVYGKGYMAISNFGKSFNESFSRSISSAGILLNQSSMVTFGDELATSFSIAPDKLENFSDLLDLSKVSKSTGRLAGSAATSIAVSSLVGMATGGLGVIPALAITSAAGMMTETMDMAGTMYRDVLAQTGSIDKANKARDEIVKAQMGNWYLYTFDGLPFVGKALRGIKRTGGRVLLAGGAESLTETAQEIPQTAQEETITERALSGEEITSDGWFEKVTPKLTKETFLEVAPGSFFMGGGGRAMTEALSSGKKNKFIKDLVANYAMSKVQVSDEFLKQKILQSNLKFGKDFTTSWVTTLNQTGKFINEEGKNDEKAFSQAIRYVNVLESIIDSPTYKKLDGKNQKLYAYFLNEYETRKQEAELAKDPISQREAKEAKNQLDNFISFVKPPSFLEKSLGERREAKKPEFSYVEVQQGNRDAMIMSGEQLIQLTEDNPDLFRADLGLDLKVTINNNPELTEQFNERFDAINDLVKEPTSVETAPAEVEKLRAEEQAEMLEQVPGAENALTDGKVDKEKLTTEEGKTKFQEIYDKYNDKISPLLETAPAEEVSEVSEEDTKSEVVYHGSPTPIEGGVLKRGQTGAIFLTPNKKYAEQYSRDKTGEVTEIKFSEQKKENLFDLRKPEHIERLKEGFLKPNEDLEIDYNSEEDALRDYNNAIRSMEEASEGRDGINDWSSGSQFIEHMENAGFEGALFAERPAGVVDENVVVSYALFDKEIPIEEISTDTTPSEEVSEEDTTLEVEELARQLGLDDDIQFQLDTKESDKELKQKLKEEAKALIDEVQPNNVETVEEPIEKRTIKIEVKENTRLAKKIKSVGLDFLIGKKVNLLMSDQLKVQLKDESKPYNKETNPYVKKGGNFFPLMEDNFGKVAWASMDNTAAGGIINGAIKSDYSVVFNMSPDAINSNRIMGETLSELLSDLDDVIKSEVFDAMKKNILSSASKNFINIVKVFEESNSIEEVFSKAQDALTVDERADIVSKILPSANIESTTEIGKLLKNLGITIELLREKNVEQFVEDLPIGALTMIVEVTDKAGNKITEDTRKEAIMSRKQQAEEGIPIHPNYKVFIRGRVVAMLNETTSFWNVLPSFGDVVDKKMAGVLRNRDSYQSDLQDPTLEFDAKSNFYTKKALVANNEDGSRTIEVRGRKPNNQWKPAGKFYQISSKNKTSTKKILEKLIGKIQVFKQGETRSAAQTKADAVSSGMKGASRSEELKKLVLNPYERFVQRLSKAFPSVEVVSSQNEFDELVKNARAKQLVTNKTQEVYGAVYQGKLYLNPQQENYNTPVHEYGHIWLNVAKELRPDLYAKGMELIENNGEYYSKVLNNKVYQSIIKKMKADGATQAEIDDYIKNEALATAIGDKGESFASAAQDKNFKNWLNELFDFIKKLVGISKITAEQLQNITLDEFLQGVTVDIMSENEAFAGAEVKSLGEQLQLMVVPEKSMGDIINYGRGEKFSDASIKLLLKKRGFKVADINNAMTLLIVDVKMPNEFSSIKGGINDAAELFGDTRKKLSQFAKGKRKKIKTPKLTAKEKKSRANQLRNVNPSIFEFTDDEILKKYPIPDSYETISSPTLAQIREKAKELLEKNPIFQSQTEAIQDSLIVSFDRTLKTRANKTVQERISNIKRKINSRKEAVKDITTFQNELRKMLKDVPQTSPVKKIILEVGKISQDNVLAQADIISSMINKLALRDEAFRAKQEALKDNILNLKEDAKFLKNLKNDARRFIFNVLPANISYTKGELKQMNGVINNINATNHLKNIETVFKLVDKKTEQSRKAKIISISKKVDEYAAVAKQAGRERKRKAKTLDAQGVSFFEEAKRILKFAIDNDKDALINIAQELSDVEAIDEALAKEAVGEELTVVEQKLLDKVYAFDTFSDILNMYLDELTLLEEAISDVKKESSVRLKQERAKRAKEISDLYKQGNRDVKNNWRGLYNIDKTLKNTNVIAKNPKSITQMFKDKQFVDATNALIDKIWSKDILQLIPNLIKDNLLHLGNASNALDKGKSSNFFQENIYKRLNRMKEAFLSGYTDQINKLDDISNSIDGITGGYREIRKMLNGKGMLIKGVESETRVDIDTIKRKIKDGDYKTIDDAKKDIADMVSNRMFFLNKKPKAIKAQVNDIMSRKNATAEQILKEQVGYIDAQSKVQDIEGITLTKDGLLRAYALSLNEVQRQKLRTQGFTDKTLKEIEDFLGPQLVDFANRIVEYLSNDYYEGVNKVHTDVNGVFLERIENYFPTKSLAQPKTKNFDVDDFASKFFAELLPSAVLGRINLKGGIQLNLTFTGELDSHIREMERYKGYASGVKTISKIMSFDFVQSLLKESGYKKLMDKFINFAINPLSPPSGAVTGIMNKFYGVTLGFKLMQIAKQSISLVNAYSDYSLSRKKGVAKTFGSLGADFLGFSFDLASMFFMFRTNLRKARAMSGIFNQRVEGALKGDVAGLESGIGIESKKGSPLSNAWNIAKTFPTTAGDIIGVMGYMAVYNRNIKNGMSQEEAVEAFNDYNRTQQTRRETELSTIQISAREQPILRLVTMFSSTFILQINEVVQASRNIKSDIDNKKMPSKRDIRSVYLNAGVSNVLFVAVSNIFKLLFGDEDDKDDVYTEMLYAMFFMNQLQTIPLIGSGIAALKNAIEGKRYNTGYAGPLDRFVINTAKSVEEEDYARATKNTVDFVIGANTDIFEGALLDPMTGSFDDESLFKSLGVSKSYQPNRNK